jgi:hypothetical protein
MIYNDRVNRVTNEANNFHIDLGNCGTSSIITRTFDDDCIVIKKMENKDKNDSKKVVLKLANDTIEVRFFSDGGNTYDRNTKGILGNTGCTFKDIAGFLSEEPEDTEAFDSRYSTDGKEIEDKLKVFLMFNSLNKWIPLINRFGTNVVASVTGGSHKRYRKSRKYQSRKKSRRHIQRHKRTHRHKSRS